MGEDVVTGPEFGFVPAPLALLNATLSDRYAIERELGRGGMATVYLARDLKHGRLVAIKLLRRELVVALGPERFLRRRNDRPAIGLRRLVEAANAAMVRLAS